jgi:hypothetical protein
MPNSAKKFPNADGTTWVIRMDQVAAAHLTPGGAGAGEEAPVADVWLVSGATVQLHGQAASAFIKEFQVKP